ncbi:MAG: nuclear transport factor 2 family protein [Sphingomonadaceae bacterium]
MDDLRRMVTELADREAIRQLVARYCHNVRQRAHEEIADMYAPDGVFDMPANMAEGGVRSGREAIIQTFTDNNERMDPWPFTHNHVIEMIDETHAKGFVYTEFRLGSQRMRTAFVGCYTDEYVKVDGDWKFHTRNLKSVNIPDPATLETA